MSFLTILPLAVVMVAGPQILSAIFLATSENWRQNSALFVFGAFLSITLIVTLAYVFDIGTIRRRNPSDTRYLIVLGFLSLAMVHVYLNRHESKPPSWMGKLEAASPQFSFRLGFLLLGFFPTDLFTSIAVGSYLAGRGAPWTDCLGFILLTLLLLALPSLILTTFGERVETFLPKARNWMNSHAWIVNEIVILIFMAITINNLLG